MASASGLEGVVVAETGISDVDGERGRLVIRGQSVEDLSENVTFEEVCGLVWNGALPSAEDRDAIRASLGRARTDAFAMLPSLGNALSLERRVLHGSSARGRWCSANNVHAHVCRVSRGGMVRAHRGATRARAIDSSGVDLHRPCAQITN